MLPGPDLVLACPTCGARVRQRTLASGNTFGATLWSDGFFDAPMLPPAPAVVRCPAAVHWFWLADAQEVGVSHWNDPQGPWDEAPYVPAPSAADLVAALAAGLGSTPDREAFLRLRLWWAENNAVRGTDAVPSPDLDNLRRLQALQDAAPANALLSEEDDEEPTERGDPVLRAAIALALGQDDRARAELTLAALPPEWIHKFARLIASEEKRLMALS